MPTIVPLPQHTAQLLSSAQLLLTPASAVKELIENALDAGASSVAIEISADTVDVIQVRDNGHGIPPDDRALFGRRGCTSKIRDEADLKAVGGKTLGFRGEAVGALAGGPGVDGVCGAVRVVTRVEGEDVGSAWSVGRWSEDGTETVSHPIGTTVQLMDFFARLPVRKQEALKKAAKCLAAVKRMLQCYALARPLVRFSLKVLKAKNTKGNWTFAPCKQPGIKEEAEKLLIEEAAVKCLGRGLAQQCRFCSFDADGYEIRAFLPKHNADSSKIGGFGQFLQVDRRPVASSKGVMKKIVKLCKEATAGAGLETVKDAFLWLELRCPEGSYDANVEPAKDDVIFVDEEVVMGVVRGLLKIAYALEERSGDSNADTVPAVRDLEEQSVIYTGRITRSRSQQLDSQIQLEESSHPVVQHTLMAIPSVPGGTNPLRIVLNSDDHSFANTRMNDGPQIQVDSTPRTQTAWKSNMYSGASDDEEDEHTAITDGPPEEDFDNVENEAEEALRSIDVSNPWIMAKLAAKPQTKQAAPIQLRTPAATPREQKGRGNGIDRYLVRKAPGDPAASRSEAQAVPQHSSSPLVSRAFKENESRGRIQPYTSFQMPRPSPVAATPEADMGTPLSDISDSSSRATRQPRANPMPQSTLQFSPQLTPDREGSINDFAHSSQQPRKKRTQHQKKFKPPAFVAGTKSSAPNRITPRTTISFARPLPLNRSTQPPVAPPSRTTLPVRTETAASKITRYFNTQPEAPLAPSPASAAAYNHAPPHLETEFPWTPINARSRTKSTVDTSPLPGPSDVHNLVLPLQASVRGIKRSLGGLDAVMNGVMWGQDPIESYVGFEGWKVGEMDSAGLVERVVAIARASGGQICWDGEEVRMGMAGGREASEEMLF